MNPNEDNKGMGMRATKVVFEIMGACQCFHWQRSLSFSEQTRLGSFLQSFFIR
jgi:hypothetical protein